MVSVEPDRIERTLPDVWLFDLARGAASRLTFGPAVNAAAVGAPQGDRMTFRTNRKGGVVELYQMSAATLEAPYLEESHGSKSSV